MMMYQLPIDMMTRMPRVILATISPPFQSASRPYGLSTISVERPLSEALVAGAAAGAVGAVVAVGGAGVAAGEAGAGACACACPSCGTIAEAAAMSRTAANAARRVVFNMSSPGRWVVESGNWLGVPHVRRMQTARA